MPGSAFGQFVTNNSSPSLAVSPTTDDTGKDGSSSTPVSVSSTKWLGPEARVPGAPAVFHGDEATSEASQSTARQGCTSTSSSAASPAQRSRKSKIPVSTAPAASSADGNRGTEQILLPVKAAVVPALDKSTGLRPAYTAGRARPTSSAKAFSIGDADDDGTSGGDYERNEFWNSSGAKPPADDMEDNSDDTVGVPDQFEAFSKMSGSASTTPKRPGAPYGGGAPASETLAASG